MPDPTISEVSAGRRLAGQAPPPRARRDRPARQLEDLFRPRARTRTLAPVAEALPEEEG